MPMRLSLRLVLAGFASLVAALVVIVAFAGRPAPSTTASAAAGAQAWAMIDRLFHVDGRVPGTSAGGPAPASPARPAAPAPGAVVAELPPAAAPSSEGGDRFGAIDRRATAPRTLPTPAATPAPVVVAPPVVAPPAAPAPAPAPTPAPLGPVSSLLDAVTSLVSGLLGILTGG